VIRISELLTGFTPLLYRALNPLMRQRIQPSRFASV
jgi:hypothetical protein